MHLQAQVLGKKRGSGDDDEVPMPPLNNLSDIFFKKKSNFCDFWKRLYK